MPYPTSGPTQRPNLRETTKILTKPRRKPKSTIRFPVDLGVILATLYFAGIAILVIYLYQSHANYNYFQKQGILYRTNLQTNISEFQWGKTWQPVITSSPLPPNPYQNLTIQEKKAIFYDKFPQYKPKPNLSKTTP